MKLYLTIIHVQTLSMSLHSETREELWQNGIHVIAITRVLMRHHLARLIISDNNKPMGQTCVDHKQKLALARELANAARTHI